ncbi:hypothetical protein [Fibrella aquatica]|uniref:hypothetical protein n=1 Tax=Fibrella aquatica TaxID=3242487 RepID=UPI003522BFF1
MPGEQAAQFIYVEEVGDPKEIVEAAKNTLSSAPLLVWEAFEEDLSANRDNYTSRIEGSMAVLYKTDGSIAARRTARLQARDALLILLEQIRLDEAEHRLPNPDTDTENERIRLEKIGPLGAHWYGMACAFYWRLPLTRRF